MRLTHAERMSDMPTDPHAPEAALVELRQYTLHPGRRDTLIELFERALIEPQEAVGMAVLAQFRDLDDADRFVWLRGFASMGERRAGLEAFYGGPVWQTHREAANATMLDSDDVLLLRPAWPGAGLRAGAPRAAAGAAASPPGCFALGCWPLREPASDALLSLCRTAEPTAGVHLRGWYVSADAPNDFPRLPVREGEPMLVGLAASDSAAACDAWLGGLQARIEPWLAGAAQQLRLQPTPRSALQA